MEKIKTLIKALKETKLWHFVFKTEQGLYLVFGGLTTLISIVTFGILDLIFAGEHYNLSTAISNIAAILFAYFTNRIYVFKSENTSNIAKSQEAVLFFATRTATLFLDMWFTGLLIEATVLPNIVCKTISTVIIIVLNYIASKLYIFKRKE